MIATPDHMHAPITLAALRAGKHVYVEKPMAHSIEEARVMTRVAKETGLVTQMGNAGHAGEGLRLTREWIQAGAIGPVREVHCWSDRPGHVLEAGPGSAHRHAARAAGPGLEPVARRAPRSGRIIRCTVPRAWRGWFDFGTGAMGDMAIHNMDPAFYALDLDAPVAAEAQTSQPLKKESYPAWAIITYEFAAQGNRPAVEAHLVRRRQAAAASGRTGTESPTGRQRHLLRRRQGHDALRRLGRHAAADPGKPHEGLPAAAEDHPAFDRPSRRVDPGLQGATSRRTPRPGSPTPARTPKRCWSATWPLRLQKPIEWDAAAMKATNAPEAEPLIRKTYRPGFGIHG